MSKKKLKLLSIAHSYVIALNRRLVNEIANLGSDEWEVTAVAPTLMKGDLRTTVLEEDLATAYKLQPIPTYFSQYIHFMLYDWRLKEILQQDWDLIHAWEEPYILSGAQIAFAKNKLSPLVFRTAQSYNKSYPVPFNWLEQYAMSQSHGWICSGQTVANALSKRPGYQKPQKLIPLGVDVNHFYPSSAAKTQTLNLLHWEENKVPVIGFLGRLVPEKGIDLLMQALAQLKTPWRALFIGTGHSKLKLQTWATQFPDQVRICTKVRHSEVAQYLNAMDILCAPSQTLPNWREQFGRMLIEAMACGVPVIGSDSGEIPYVLEGVGRVVGEKDTTGWVTAISELIEHPELRQEMRTKGLEKAQNVYAWEKVAEQHLTFFREVREASHLDNRSGGS
jgi:glycosyltransferase involved in cell wall biosynthesis